MKTKQFDNKEQLQAIIAGLPKAHAETLHRGAKLEEVSDIEDQEQVKNPSKNPEEKRVAIINEETDKMATVASDKYDIVQHREAFQPLVNALTDAGMDVKGSVKTFNNENGVMIKGRLKDTGFNIQDDSDYVTGFRLKNSYDTSCSVTLRGMTERLVCSNGMTIPTDIIKPVRRTHVGNVDVVKEYRGFFSRLIDSVPTFRDMLLEAREEFFNEPVVVLRNAGVPETKVERVIERIERQPDSEFGTEKYSRKQVYDALTNFITEEIEDEKTISTEEGYHRKAERVLTSPKAKLTQPLEVEE